MPARAGRRRRSPSAVPRSAGRSPPGRCASDGARRCPRPAGPRARTIRVNPLSAILASFSSGGPEVGVDEPEGDHAGQIGEERVRSLVLQRAAGVLRVRQVAVLVVGNAVAAALDRGHLVLRVRPWPRPRRITSTVSGTSTTVKSRPRTTPCRTHGRAHLARRVRRRCEPFDGTRSQQIAPRAGRADRHRRPLAVIAALGQEQSVPSAKTAART